MYKFPWNYSAVFLGSTISTVVHNGHEYVPWTQKAADVVALPPCCHNGGRISPQGINVGLGATYFHSGYLQVCFDWMMTSPNVVNHHHFKFSILSRLDLLSQAFFWSGSSICWLAAWSQVTNEFAAILNCWIFAQMSVIFQGWVFWLIHQ